METSHENDCSVDVLKSFSQTVSQTSRRCFIIMGGRKPCSDQYKPLSSWTRVTPPYEVDRGHNNQTADIRRVPGGKNNNKVSQVGGELSEQPFYGLQGHAERQPFVTLCQTSSNLKQKKKQSLDTFEARTRPSGSLIQTTKSAALNGCFDWMKPFEQTLRFSLLLFLFAGFTDAESKVVGHNVPA